MLVNISKTQTIRRCLPNPLENNKTWMNFGTCSRNELIKCECFAFVISLRIRKMWRKTELVKLINEILWINSIKLVLIECHVVFGRSNERMINVQKPLNRNLLRVPSRLSFFSIKMLLHQSGISFQPSERSNKICKMCKPPNTTNKMILKMSYMRDVPFVCEHNWRKRFGFGRNRYARPSANTQFYTIAIAYFYAILTACVWNTKFMRYSNICALILSFRKTRETLPNFAFCCFTKQPPNKLTAHTWNCAWCDIRHNWTRAIHDVEKKSFP